MSFLGEAFGRVVKGRRKELKLKQADFAKSMGVEAPTVSNWENGVSIPVNERIDGLLEALALKPQDFLARMALSQGATAETHMAQAILRLQEQLDSIQSHPLFSLLEKVEPSQAELIDDLMKFADDLLQSEAPFDASRKSKAD